MPSRVLLDSSAIREASYDDELARLELVFAESGARYEYFMVPRSIFDGLVDAESAGAYFAAHIRDKFRTRKVSD